jgi:hypothetical protein
MRDQPERVTVTDPAHPLFRREFVLVAVRGSPITGQAVVVRRGDLLLKLSIQATSLCAASPRLPASKLSLLAIRDLVRLGCPVAQANRVPILETSPAAAVGDGAEAQQLTSRRESGGEP